MKLRSEYHRAWREANPERYAEIQKQRQERVKADPALSEQQRERVKRAEAKAKARTDPTVSRRMVRWTEAEDRYILATLDQRAEDVAIKLGRSLYAVRMRRNRLRAEEESV